MEQLALALWASVCGYQDIKRLRVSNWLILGGFLISFVYLYVKESSLTGATVNMAMTALFIGVCLSLPATFSAGSALPTSSTWPHWAGQRPTYGAL